MFYAAFSYYGSKSKIAQHYPAPRGSLIIEPFAGSAAYSLRHHLIAWPNAQEVQDYRVRSVWINDLDPQTYAIWQFLTSKDALEWVRLLPDHVRTGQTVGEILFLLNLNASGTGELWAEPRIPIGLEALIRAEVHMGTAGTAARYEVVTSISALCWNRRLKRRLEWVIPRVRHWTVTNMDYRELPVSPEDGCPTSGITWFVDPPYANAAGAAYRTNAVGYEELAQWCLERAKLHHVIVCENQGAEWLPFRPLGVERRRGFNTRARRTNVPEVVWEGGPHLTPPSPQVVSGFSTNDAGGLPPSEEVSVRADAGDGTPE